jgi:hypothetical protein
MKSRTLKGGTANDVVNSTADISLPPRQNCAATQ